jgi:hypothetical protein
LKLTDQMFKGQQPQEPIVALPKAIFTDQILSQ